MANVEGIRILDATVRDGGLVNDFYFTDELVRAVYAANLAAGVDYMEFGYRADRRQFDPAKFGPWKFTSDDDIRRIIGGEKAGLKVSVMCDVGRTDFRRDLRPRAESPVDLVRVATYIDAIDQAVEMIEYADAMGYETACNIMAISTCTDGQMLAAMDALARCPAMVVYLVDSYGALYPKQVRHITRLFRDRLSPAGKFVGVHAHNNQQCAFANTLEARDMGARFLDGTAYGMGRGAGNCHMEALLGVYNGKKYHVEPILDLVQHEMLALKEQGAARGQDWGYNTSYLLTGLTNQHPRDAIAATRAGNHDFKEQYLSHAYQ